MVEGRNACSFVIVSARFIAHAPWKGELSMNSGDYGNPRTRSWRNNERSAPTYAGQASGGYSATPGNVSNSQPTAGCQVIPGVNPGCCTTRCSITSGKDYGPNPYVVNIDNATLENPYFRRALWTGNDLQVTLMCIGPGQEIGLEMHADLEQFLRLEQGHGVVMMGQNSNNLTYQQDVAANYAILIPAGTWHNLINTGTVPIKLYSIYAPPQHPHGRIQCTKADSDADEVAE